MFQEIIASAKEQAAERLASPLIGSFAVSWCLWNYKFIVILFSEASVSRTFEMIATVSFPDAFSVALRGVVLPLLTAAAYIFVYPYPAKYVYGFTLRRQREINDLRRQIADETPLTLEESRQLRAEVFAVDTRHREEVDRLNAELSQAKAAMLNREGSSATDDSSGPMAIRPNLSPSQLKVLGLLREVGGQALHKELMPPNLSERVGAEYDLGELQRLKLIRRDYDQGQRDYSYELTHDGRRLVLERPARDSSDPDDR